MIDFSGIRRQNEFIGNHIDAAIKSVISHGQFILGPEVYELEEKLAKYVGVKHAITVASGTDALIMALMASGVGPGDEVITTPYSFFATTEAILSVGAMPVFVDIGDDFNIDPLNIEVTSNTKAILAVSLFGLCVDFDNMPKTVVVIEDGAQSFGAEYKGKKSGSFGIGATSFFPAKILGCYGDGGCVFTDSDSIAETIALARSHGQVTKYRHASIGTNSRLDTIQAAILLEKLSVFDRELKDRKTIAERYIKELAGCVEVQKGGTFSQFTIKTDRRDELRAHLMNVGIPTMVYYPIPIHMQPAIGWGHLNLPNTVKASRTALSIPCNPYLQDDEVDHIIKSIKGFYQ